MPPVVRLGDIDTGHGCWPPRPNAQGSPNVFANGIPAHRLGDAWSVHCCPTIPECHASNLAGASPNVFVNGIPWGRIGDAVACGSSCAQGSPNVFAN